LRPFAAFAVKRKPMQPGKIFTLAASVILALPAVVLAAPPERHTFDANGVKISYAVHGTGEPVLLIHGWLSSAAINWDLPGTTALLAKKFQVITFDVPGHGQSDAPTDETAYGPELVADVLGLLDHLKIKKAHIVGYSMGGILAANFIAKHPDRVLSGTLGGMGWLKEGGFAQRAFAQIGRREPNAAAKTICGRSLAKLSLSEPEITSIRVPMLILVGADDRLIQRMYVDPLRAVRPDWRVVEIPDSNHLTSIAHPEFKEQILKWLEKNSR
jgi:pimeloyl-ACP methyl ester carboxylesterase